MAWNSRCSVHDRTHNPYGCVYQNTFYVHTTPPPSVGAHAHCHSIPYASKTTPSSTTETGSSSVPTPSASKATPNVGKATPSTSKGPPPSPKVTPSTSKGTQKQPSANTNNMSTPFGTATSYPCEPREPQQIIPSKAEIVETIRYLERVVLAKVFDGNLGMKCLRDLMSLETALTCPKRAAKALALEITKSDNNKDGKNKKAESEDGKRKKEKCKDGKIKKDKRRNGKSENDEGKDENRTKDKSRRQERRPKSDDGEPSEGEVSSAPADMALESSSSRKTGRNPKSDERRGDRSPGVSKMKWPTEDDEDLRSTESSKDPRLKESEKTTGSQPQSDTPKPGTSGGNESVRSFVPKQNPIIAAVLEALDIPHFRKSERPGSTPPKPTRKPRAEINANTSSFDENDPWNVFKNSRKRFEKENEGVRNGVISVDQDCRAGSSGIFDPPAPEKRVKATCGKITFIYDGK